MKPFEVYQTLPGEPMTERDKQQVSSKFWNKGKWDNFVVPHLPEDCAGLSFVDMGCNSGLFLKFAEERGFSQIMGVENNEEAVRRGRDWAERNHSKYQIIQEKMEGIIDKLPIVDYTLLANAHYYFYIADWLDYLDKLRFKTRYAIIVTTEKKFHNRCWAESDLTSIRRYFKDWKEVSFVNELPTEGDPDPRRLWSLCFESPIEKVAIEKIHSRNNVQIGFYKELDEGTYYKDTRYYGILKKYREKWGKDKLKHWIKDKMAIYESIKKDGQFKPILVDDEYTILDGNHRYQMLKNLRKKDVFIRRT